MGEIKKIRIGNDIRLAVDLRQKTQYISYNYLMERDVYAPEAPDFENIDSNDYVNKNYEVYYPNQYTISSESIDDNAAVDKKYEVYYPNQYSDEECSNDGSKTNSLVAIRKVKAFLINVSKQKEYEDFMRKKTRFIARYPIEPCLECFHSTPYNICNSGYPTWRAYPHSYCAAPYHGYGVTPEWNTIYHKLPPKPRFEYRAPVIATKDQNIVEVAFPAEAQFYTGLYKLVLVAKVYVPGFNYQNLKTITVDASNVFELVKTTEEGIDTGVEINVNCVNRMFNDVSTYPVEDDIYNDIYVKSGEYEDDNIILTRTDGTPVNVDTSEFTAWYEGD